MQSESQEIKRHRRGDPSAVDSSLVFFRYNRGKEIWVTREFLNRDNEQRKVSHAKYRSKPENKEKAKLYFRKYNNLPKQKEYLSAYYKNPEVREKIRAEYAIKSAKKKAEKQALETPGYLQYKADKRAAKIRLYEKARYQNPNHRIAKICRARIIDALKYQKAHKTSRTKTLLGCEYDFFRGWIEAQFERGMSWMNFGIFWEIDHRIPVASFVLTDPSQQLECFHYSNCRPLWKNLNKSKGDKMPDGSLGRHVRTQLN